MNMNNNKFIENIKHNNSFAYKFIFNKKIKFFYYIIPTIFLLLFFVLGIVFISINSHLLIAGLILLALTIFILIIFFILSYFEKKFKNQVKSYFNLPNILSMNLIETKMYDRNYLSIYHSCINNTRELKWSTKTYSFKNNNNNELLMRFSFINNFSDDKTLLIKPKKITQIYLQKTLNNFYHKKLFIYKNNDLNDLKVYKIDKHIFYYKGEINNINNDNEIKKMILAFDNLDVNFNIICEQDKINIYIAENNNFLFVNFMEKFNEDEFNKNLYKINEIIDII